MLFMSNPAKDGMYYEGALFHNKLFGELLVIRNKDKDIETLKLSID
jgi:hypothetical protein